MELRLKQLFNEQKTNKLTEGKAEDADKDKKAQAWTIQIVKSITRINQSLPT